MRYDFNALEMAAAGYLQNGEIKSAMRIYYFMADGDPSLDAGWLGRQIALCYEKLDNFQAARYWYHRAVEENPAREDCIQSLKRLEKETLDDLIDPERYVLNE